MLTTDADVEAAREFASDAFREGVSRVAVRARFPRPRLRGCWIEGTARLALRVKQPNFTALTLRLADELRVDAITSREWRSRATHPSIWWKKLAAREDPRDIYQPSSRVSHRTTRSLERSSVTEQITEFRVPLTGCLRGVDVNEDDAALVEIRR